MHLSQIFADECANRRRKSAKEISVYQREKMHLPQIIADEYADRPRESAKGICGNQREKNISLANKRRESA